MNTNRNNSNETVAENGFDTNGHRPATEIHTAAPRPHVNGDEKIPMSPPTSKGAAHQKRQRQILAAAAALVVALATGVYYFRFVAPFETTDDAFIEGHVTAVASQVSGRVARLLVRDNQEVKQGDLLLEIDPRDYEAKLAQAQADLKAAQSQLEEAKSQFGADLAKANQERANLVSVEAQAAYAETDLTRKRTIGISGVSQDQIDAAETQVRSTAADVLVARNKISAAEAQSALSLASVGTAKAKIAQSEAALRQAELNLSYTKITAPEAGRVTRRVVEQGNYIQPGQSLLAIVPKNIWVIANYKETQLTHMRPGQPVAVEVDAYPQFKFKGHVDSIQNGAGARFSLFPPENATGNYIKVVQRVPVKIVLDETPESDLALGPGMSVDPKVRVR
ncbi:MAG TPA: HlyD family secretion protein [Verrucomicrobiae bacterium]|nr:HlyD family secretion protein [Verrucomicrobiae bacterium]